MERWWTNPLWAKDLLIQSEYCARLILVCPLFSRCEPDWVEVAAPNLEIRPLPPARKRWPAQLATLYRIVDGAVRDCDIAYAAVAGWPFPLGFLVTLAARRRHRFLVTNVESAPWRAYDGTTQTLRSRIARGLFERHARFCAVRANVLTVTQPEYLDLVTGDMPAQGVFPASWIDADAIVTPDQADALWEAKSGRLFHGGRLNDAKGTGLLLDALEAMGNDAPSIDIAGFGPLEDRCAEVAARSGGRIRIVPMVAYGQDFSALLDRYRAVILPQLSDEQPRLLFDAFARAVPVIASDRKGIRSCVTPGVSAWLFTPGDRDALTTLLRRACEQPEDLRRMGLAALKDVAGRTHQAMHRERADFIAGHHQRWATA